MNALLTFILSLLFLPQTTLEKEMPRPTPLPAIMEYVSENIDEFQFEVTQISEIKELQNNSKSPIDSSLKIISEMDLRLRTMSKENAPLEDIVEFNKKVIMERVRLTKLKLKYRDELIAIVGVDNWNTIADKYDLDKPYELGIVVERISPIPNYMIVAYYIDGLNLTDDQKKQIDNWNEEGHYKAMLMLSAMAEQEQEVRTAALENMSDSEVVEKLKKLEMMRHKLLITKTECRDYIKQKVLQPEQWDLMIAKMDE